MKIRTFQQRYAQTRESAKRRDLLNEVASYHALTTPIDKLGNTLIHYVIEHGELEDIDYLLFMLSGSEIDTPNYFGHSALAVSVLTGKQTVTSLLLYHGADPTLPDRNGYSAFDHNLQRAKPLALVAESLIPILPSIWMHLDALRTPNDMRAFLAWLEEQHYPLDKIISSNDSSILYYIMHLASTRAISVLLPQLQNEILTITNARDATILQSLIEKNRYVPASILIHRLSQYIPRKALPYFLANGKMIIERPIDVYLEVQQLLENLAGTFNIDETICEIEALGFELDDPINGLDDTPLHYLINIMPADDFKKLIEARPDVDLDVRNVHGRSLIDLAASNNRFSLMKILSDEGVFFDFRTLDEKAINDYLAYCSRKTNLSTYAYLHRIFSEARKVQPDDQECAIACFNLFMDYLKRCHFKYDGSDRDGEHFLDEPAGKGFTINCVDVSMAFGHLLASIGIKGLHLHRYYHIMSRRFSDKGKLQGDFVCFDNDYQKHKLTTKSFAFNMHTVLRVGTHLFDPTFSCHYAHPEDLHYPRIPNRRLHTIEVVVANRVTSEPVDYRRFKLQFLAKLHGILPPETSHYQFYGNSLRISHNYTTVNISDEAGGLHVTAQHYSSHRVINIIDAWVATNKASNIKVRVCGTHQIDVEHLTKYYNSTPSSKAKRVFI